MERISSTTHEGDGIYRAGHRRREQKGGGGNLSGFCLPQSGPLFPLVVFAFHSAGSNNCSGINNGLLLFFRSGSDAVGHLIHPYK